jgi:hypothetical protein
MEPVYQGQLKITKPLASTTAANLVALLRRKVPALAVHKDSVVCYYAN